MIAVVVAAFAVPALIWLSTLVGVVIIVLGVAFWATVMIRLSPRPRPRPPAARQGP
jgi:hypothetical protein